MTNTQSAKARLRAGGYVPPGHGACCRRCARGEVFMHGGTKRVKCGAHSAVTTCGGWCPSFAPVVMVKAA